LYRMMDFGVSAEELRQTTVCISAQRLIRRTGGRLAAVFQIIQDDQLDQLKLTMITGESADLPYEGSVEALARKYSSTAGLA